MDDMPSSIEVLGDLLERQALLRPDAEALTDGRARLTWREYRDRADELAGRLREQGVGPGDRVAVHLPKSVESFVSVHAILRLGAVMVPLDWFAPSDYLRRLLADAEVTAVVSGAPAATLAELFEAGDTTAVVSPSVDVMAGRVDHAGAATSGRVTVDDDAYIVYTSGSTGHPKGIVHTHASALAYARRAADIYGLGPDDRLANVAPLHFDQSTFELYAAPLVGAAVVVLSDVILRFPASTSDLVASERVTVWYSVPFAITQLVNRGAIEQRDLGALRWVLFGGESFPSGALAAAMQALPSARFSNVYGPAEVNQCTAHHLDVPPTDGLPVPLGDDWDGADLLLIDEHGEPVIDSTPAELLVHTDTMMNRYWRRPDLTAAAIVRRDDGSGTRSWYRTGDLVSRFGDGELVFTGRVDHQVKVRGHRVELEAVEAVIAEHRSVVECAVMVDRRDDGDRLVAVLVPAPSADIEAALMEQLRSRLPRYAVPDELIGTGSLPRSRNGKIDRATVSSGLAGLRENHELASNAVESGR